jgi:microcin C transport system permease protein
MSTDTLLKPVSANPWKRQWRNFRNRKTAFYSLIVLLTGIILSLGAELIANNTPYAVVYKGSLYLPMVKNYAPQEFDYAELSPNYREICKSPEASCIFPPVRFNAIEIDSSYDHYPAPPSLAHPMGLDALGRDIFARMLYGFRVSFSYAVGVWLLAFTIGTIIGSSMGYFGGLFDITFYRLMEIFFAIPYLIVLITLASIFTPNLALLIVISSIFSWGNITRYMRAEFLRIRKQDFVASARAAGCTTRQIIFRHILPNALIPIITFSPFFISHGILGLSALDFLGLGVQPPTPSWGELLKQGKEHFLTAWYLAVFPAAGLFTTLALINFVGEGVRDAFDPRRY